MNKRGIFVLFVLGLLLFVESAIIASKFPLGEVPPDLAPISLYIREIRISQLATSLNGSLFGCLACWLWALYLRTRWLEREINARLGTAVPLPEVSPPEHMAQ